MKTRLYHSEKLRPHHLHETEEREAIGRVAHLANEAKGKIQDNSYNHAVDVLVNNPNLHKTIAEELHRLGFADISQTVSKNGEFNLVLLRQLRNKSHLLESQDHVIKFEPVTASLRSTGAYKTLPEVRHDICLSEPRLRGLVLFPITTIVISDENSTPVLSLCVYPKLTPFKRREQHNPIIAQEIKKIIYLANQLGYSWSDGRKVENYGYYTDDNGRSHIMLIDLDFIRVSNTQNDSRYNMAYVAMNDFINNLAKLGYGEDVLLTSDANLGGYDYPYLLNCIKNLFQSIADYKGKVTPDEKEIKSSCSIIQRLLQNDNANNHHLVTPENAIRLYDLAIKSIPSAQIIDQKVAAFDRNFPQYRQGVSVAQSLSSSYAINPENIIEVNYSSNLRSL